MLTTARPTRKYRIFRSAASPPLVLMGERWLSKAIVPAPYKFAPDTQPLMRSTSAPTHRMSNVPHASAQPVQGCGTIFRRHLYQPCMCAGDACMRTPMHTNGRPGLYLRQHAVSHNVWMCSIIFAQSLKLVVLLLAYDSFSLYFLCLPPW